jgi:hypothetical protein
MILYFRIEKNDDENRSDGLNYLKIITKYRNLIYISNE